MKRTLVAILALSPVMIHAQTASPAQPASTPVLQSTNVQPVALAAIHSGAAPAAPSAVRISTGVTEPKCIHAGEVVPNLALLPKSLAVPRKVVVALTIDETGTPTNLHLTKTTDPITDAAVVKALTESRYEPAKLDGTPVAIEATLTYVIQ